MHCWWECKLVQLLWKTVWRFLKKLKVELVYDPTIPLLGIYLREKTSLSQRDICTPKFIEASFMIDKTWKQPKCPSMDEWVKKMWYIYSGILFSPKEKESLLFVTTWMNLKGIRVNEMSEREKQIGYDLTLV